MLDPRNAEQDRLQAVVKKFKKTTVRPNLTREEMVGWETPDQKAGVAPVVATNKPHIDAFLTKEKAAVEHYQRTTVEIPNWLKAKIETKASPTEVLDFLIDRVKKAPSKDSLLLMQMVLNDMGRKPDGSKHFNLLIQKQNVVEFINLTNPKK